MRRLIVLLASLSLATAAHADDARLPATRALDRLQQQVGPVTVLWPDRAPAPRHLSGFRSAAVAGGPLVAARAFLRGHGAALGLRDAARELRHAATVATGVGTIVRFTQEVDGVPVYGADLAVAVDAHGRVFLVNSAVQPRPAKLATPLIADGAARAAVAARGAVAGKARLVAVPTGAELRPCFVVYGRTLRPFGIWDYLVDAQTGDVVRRLSRLRAARGRVYEDSPAQGAGLIDVDLPHLTGAETLTGDYADTYRATMRGNNSVTKDRKAVPVNGDYLFDPQEHSFTDPFAEVQMYYHVSRIHQWFADTFGFARVGRGADQHIDLFANFATDAGNGQLQPYDNAFYGDLDGDGHGDLTFGQGGLDFSYDAEVIYHEFTHSVVDEGPKLDGLDIDALGLFLDPGSLNEAFADYFSSTFVGDPILGEYVGQEMGQGGAIRRMTDPAGEHASCPGTLSGETHADGVVWARALWDTRSMLDVATADQVIWAALQSLNGSTTFTQAARSVTAMARVKLGDAAGAYIEASMAARGLDDCSRIVPVAGDEERTGTVMGQQNFGNIQVPQSLQYEIKVPADATKVTFSFDKQGYSGGSVTLIPLLRKDQAVGVNVSGWNLSYQADFTGQNNRALVLSVDTPDKLLVPGSAYYLLVTNDSQDDMFFRMHVTLGFTPPAPAKPDGGVAPAPAADAAPAAPDGGTGPAAAGGTGGGCSVSGAPAPAGALALLLLGLALARRRH
ncbi:MAG TPA: MYXO-CTERM sorting domain-containing protein [Polyangia bacterium]|jgi:MYXO-CTERM domain-containing protein